MKRIDLIGSVMICLACVGAGRLASAQSTDVRVARAVKTFVAGTGYQVIGVGSWIVGKGYTPGSSDHDLRLLIPQGTPNAEARAAWAQARRRLTEAIQKEFGDQADDVLKKTNLYAPSQLMTGVEDADDALRAYVRMNQVPSLAHAGPVTTQTPARFVEGLYGDGSKAFTQLYEESKGRIFYRSGNACVTGATDLTHFSEGRAVFTVHGTANTAEQWGRHALEELAAGDGRAVGKQLSRLERDLVKSRELAGLAANTSLRTELQELQTLLKQAPGRARALTGRITDLVARGQAEAGMLKVYGKSGPLRQGIVRILMDAVSAGDDLGRLLQSAYAPISRVATFENLCTGVVACFAARQVSRAFADSWVAAGKELAAFYALLPTGIMMQITDAVLEQAKENGYVFAANSQEAWDLMTGVYSAWGRAQSDPDPRRLFTLDDLVARYQSEARLKALIYSQAMRASCRNLGGSADDTDMSVANAIYTQCMPVILQAWRWRRDELFGEYTEIGRMIQHAPLLIFYSPAPASTAGGPVTITATARSLAPRFDENLDRMEQILKLLAGKRSGVLVDYEWTPQGTGDDERTATRQFTFDEPGTHPVKVHLKVWPAAPGVDLNSRLLIRRDVWAETDVEVTGGSATGYWVLDKVEIRKRFQPQEGTLPLHDPAQGWSHTYGYSAKVGETGAQASLSIAQTLTLPEKVTIKSSRTVRFSWKAPPRALDDGQSLTFDVSAAREGATYEASPMNADRAKMRDAFKQPAGKASISVYCVIPYKNMTAWAGSEAVGGTDDRQGELSLKGRIPTMVRGGGDLEIQFQIWDRDAQESLGFSAPTPFETLVVYVYRRGEVAK